MKRASTLLLDASYCCPECPPLLLCTWHYPRVPSCSNSSSSNSSSSNNNSYSSSCSNSCNSSYCSSSNNGSSSSRGKGCLDLLLGTCLLAALPQLLLRVSSCSAASFARPTSSRQATSLLSLSAAAAARASATAAA